MKRISYKMILNATTFTATREQFIKTVLNGSCKVYVKMAHKDGVVEFTLSQLDSCDNMISVIKERINLYARMYDLTIYSISAYVDSYPIIIVNCKA